MMEVRSFRVSVKYVSFDSQWNPGCPTWGGAHDLDGFGERLLGRRFVHFEDDFVVNVKDNRQPCLLKIEYRLGEDVPGDALD